MTYVKTVVAAAAVFAMTAAPGFAQSLGKFVVTKLAEMPVAELPDGELYWHVENFGSLDEAKAAGGAFSLAAEFDGKAWLFTLADRKAAGMGGALVALIGPVPRFDAALCIKRTNKSEPLPRLIGYLSAMQDKTITSALLQPRAQIIRGKLDGFDHVEALLAARGVDLPHVPKPHADNSMPRLGMMRLLVEALRDGPKGGVAAASYVAEHQPDISYREAQRRIHQGLARAVAHGYAVRDGGVWRLA